MFMCMQHAMEDFYFVSYYNINFAIMSLGNFYAISCQITLAVIKIILLIIIEQLIIEFLLIIINF